MTTAERIIALLRGRASADDEEISRQIGSRRQTVNRECRRLAANGFIIRERDATSGKLANRVVPVQNADFGAAAEERKSTRDRANAMSAGPMLLIGPYPFHQICRIEPMRNENGEIARFEPQARFRNARALALNKFGHGPFCKFKIPADSCLSGVYAIIVNGELKYIGECENLAARYNMGYGNISPRNCFVGGQETNCRINNLVYELAEAASDISLWFCETTRHKSIERELRASLKPAWNRI